MSVATGHCLIPVPHLHMLRFPFFSCYISPIASYPSLYKHNASLVRYNQTRFADSKYCGFVKTVVANMEKVIRICKDSFSPLVPRPHRRQPPVRLLMLQEEPPPLQGAPQRRGSPPPPGDGQMAVLRLAGLQGPVREVGRPLSLSKGRAADIGHFERNRRRSREIFPFAPSNGNA